MANEVEIRLTREGLEVGAVEVEKIQSITLELHPSPVVAQKHYEVVWSKVTTVSALKQLLQLMGNNGISLPASTDVSKITFLKAKV